MLQHRGQDAAGIVTCHQGRLFLRKDNGMVRDVFHTRHMRALLGNHGIGHVRYPNRGFIQQCGGTAILCELSVRYYPCTQW